MLEKSKNMKSKEKEIYEMDNMLDDILGVMASTGNVDAECILEGSKLMRNVNKIAVKIVIEKISKKKLKQITSLFKQTQKLLDDILEEEEDE